MSPEQAKGAPSDKRSDVWGFGCVLYEMLAGRRAFEGEDVVDTLAAILRGEPDWTALPPTRRRTCARWSGAASPRIARRAFPTVAVVRFLLDESAGTGVQCADCVRPRRRHDGAACLAAVAVLCRSRRSASARAVYRLAPDRDGHTLLHHSAREDDIRHNRPSRCSGGDFARRLEARVHGEGCRRQDAVVDPAHRFAQRAVDRPEPTMRLIRSGRRTAEPSATPRAAG